MSLRALTLKLLGTPTVLTTIGVAETSPSSATTPSSSTQSSETSEDTQSPETESATPAESSTELPGDSPSKGLTIGLAVGIPIGVLGLAAGGLMFFWSRRKLQVGGQEMPVQQTPLHNGSTVGYPDANGMDAHHNKTPQLLEAWVPPTEVHGGVVNPIHELPTGHK